MSRIVPYNEDLYKNEGAFVYPSGEIVFTYGDHEGFARSFCIGDSLFCTLEELENSKTSKLSSEQRELFKHWIYEGDTDPRTKMSDFLVQFLSFDKIKTIGCKAIVTTSDCPHIRFFNYYLMDWHVQILNRLIYNREQRTFCALNKGWYQNPEDKRVEKEIEDIKRRVLIKDRHHFFK